MSGLPTPFHIDRGEPLTPQQVAGRVYRRRCAVPDHKMRDFQQRVVVVHPMVLEDCALAVIGPIPGTADDWWRRCFSENPSPEGRPEVKCCGLRMDSDPFLRYDEIRLRQEEVLT